MTEDESERFIDAAGFTWAKTSNSFLVVLLDPDGGKILGTRVLVSYENADINFGPLKRVEQ